MNILAAANKESPNKLIGINELLRKHYATYGRSFFSRYDYEEVASEGANQLVARLNEAIKTSSFANTSHRSKSTGQDYKIASVSNFSYTDPIDKSVSANQGQIVLFDDGSRVVFRLSGTGSAGATVRMYVERYLGPDAGEKELSRDTAEGLKGLIEVALEITKLKEFLQRDEPTVITVRVTFFDQSSPLNHRLMAWFSKLCDFGKEWGCSAWEYLICTMVWNTRISFSSCGKVGESPTNYHRTERWSKYMPTLNLFNCHKPASTANLNDSMPAKKKVAFHRSIGLPGKGGQGKGRIKVIHPLERSRNARTMCGIHSSLQIYIARSSHGSLRRGHS